MYNRPDAIQKRTPSTIDRKYRSLERLEDRDRERSDLRGRLINPPIGGGSVDYRQDSMTSGRYRPSVPEAYPISEERFDGKAGVGRQATENQVGWIPNKVHAAQVSEFSRPSTSGTVPSQLTSRWDPKTKWLGNDLPPELLPPPDYTAATVGGTSGDLRHSGYNPGYAYPQDARAEKAEYPGLPVKQFPGYNPGYAPGPLDFSRHSQQRSHESKPANQGVSAKEIAEEHSRTRKRHSPTKAVKSIACPQTSTGLPDFRLDENERNQLTSIPRGTSSVPKMNRPNRSLDHLGSNGIEKVQLPVEVEYEIPMMGESPEDDSIREWVLGSDGQNPARIARESGAIVELNHYGTAIFIQGTDSQVNLALTLLEEIIRNHSPDWKTGIAARTRETANGRSLSVPHISAQLSDPSQLINDEPAIEKLLHQTSPPQVDGHLDPGQSGLIQALDIPSSDLTPTAIKVELGDSLPDTSSPIQITADNIPLPQKTMASFDDRKEQQEEAEAFLRSIVKSRISETKRSSTSALSSITAAPTNHFRNGRALLDLGDRIAKLIDDILASLVPSGRNLSAITESGVHDSAPAYNRVETPVLAVSPASVAPRLIHAHSPSPARVPVDQPIPVGHVISPSKSHLVRLPTDEDSLGLIGALNAFRNGRGLFPFGNLHLDKLLRLISLTEGPFKMAMSETDRFTSNTER